MLNLVTQKKKLIKSVSWHVSLLKMMLSLTFFFSPLAAASDADFEELLDRHWQATLKTNPTFATSLGVRDYDSELSDPSLEASEAEVTQAKTFLKKLIDIDKSSLSSTHQLNRDLLILDLENSIEDARHGAKYMIMNNRSGPHLDLTGIVNRLPFFSEADYKSYISRMDKMAEYLNKSTDRLRAGIQAGWVQPCAPMQGFERSISTHLVENPKDSTFMSPFENKPDVINDTRFNSMKNRAQQIVSKEILPAFSEFMDFYMEEYKPACRKEVGTDSMPGGKEYYDYRVKYFTTTDQTADEIHNTGLKEVARIKAEMMAVIKEAKFDGDFEQWLEFLATNEDFYPKTAQERLDAVAVISKKIDGELPKLFGLLPRMPYGIKEIPTDIAEKSTTAYYSRPAGDGSRAGFHYVNTSLLDTRPLYQLEALSLHEAVPGHHLQIALMQELELPMFRKFGGQTVFVEGWGLYAERLGLEVGFYQTPYTNFGRLSYEMWRACRLVVDTGLHSKGWSRQKAIDYMAANSGLSMNNITSEVDRYITWPAQALAYKTGELKIRELRALAEKQLGADFDVRAFHDKVLENGALPLSILERIIKDWLKTQ
jgi:uncharacterized protein (DUF885 family)